MKRAAHLAAPVHDRHCRSRHWQKAGLKAIAVNAFAEEFDRVREETQLTGEIRKFASPYYGIRLANSNVARQTARKK
jgi:hypothetical protein